MSWKSEKGVLGEPEIVNCPDKVEPKPNLEEQYGNPDYPMSAYILADLIESTLPAPDEIIKSTGASRLLAKLFMEQIEKNYKGNPLTKR